MNAIVLRGDARALPLPDASVDLIVTSPPYWVQRDYRDNGVSMPGQIGSEATWQEWLTVMVACTREWARALKPVGNMFVNLGDKMVDKSLLLLPERYVTACRDQLGLIVRRDIIWAKPNGLPESVTDRCRSSHEYLFHMTLQPRYYAAVDEIREPHHDNARPNGQRSPRDRISPGGKRMESGEGAAHRTFNKDADYLNPLGKLPGSVWNIPSQPLTVPAHLGVDHFAAFPFELPRRCILGWSPRAICDDCGFLLGSSYDYGMLGVRRSHNGRARQGRVRETQGTGKEPLLQEGMLSALDGQEQGVYGLSAADDPRLCGDLEAEPPDGPEGWLHDGTQVRHGGASRAATGIQRGRTPHQRHQDGQPDRELGATRQGPPRPAAQATAQAVPVPALRRSHSDVRDLLPCPHCGSNQTRPSLIVDCFGGTGTTALVAAMHGRVGVSIDRSADYTRLARWRTTDPGERAKAAGVPKPPPIPDGMEALF